MQLGPCSSAISRSDSPALGAFHNQPLGPFGHSRHSVIRVLGRLDSPLLRLLGSHRSSAQHIRSSTTIASAYGLLQCLAVIVLRLGARPLKPSTSPPLDLLFPRRSLARSSTASAFGCSVLIDSCAHPVWCSAAPALTLLLGALLRSAFSGTRNSGILILWRTSAQRAWPKTPSAFCRSAIRAHGPTALGFSVDCSGIGLC